MISLLYAGNRKVFGGMLLSLLSVTNHCHDMLDIHIATMDWREKNDAYQAITQEQAAFLQETVRRANPHSHVIRHDMRDFFLKELADSPNALSVYTPYTLLRLLIDEVPGMPDKIIYLDTDTVALGSLAGLMRFPVDRYDFAAAKDYLGKFFINSRYMNAGVMLLNIAQMRQSGFLSRCRALCREKKYAFPDQDVINHCEKKKCFLPRRFNEQKHTRRDTVIRHFSKTIRWLPVFHTVNIKPWDEEGLHTVYKTHRFDDLLAEYRQAMEAWERSEQA